MDCLSPEAQRLAEARLAAKRAARAEAREIRMRELERQQKEIYQVQKKYYGLDTKWGDIERWMEDSERYSRRSRRNTSASDEEERASVGSRGSLRTQSDLESGGPHVWTNGCDGEWSGSQSLSRRPGRGPSCSDLRLPGSGLPSKPLSVQNGNRASVLGDGGLPGAPRGSVCGSHRAPSEYSSHLNSSSRASSRASSARASPVVEERPEKDFTEKGSRNMPGLSAATLASLGGTSSRRGSGDTSISMDTEASIREIKELNELKDQIQDVEGKYMQGLKEMKDSLAEVEEKYKKAMVSNAQLDNEKTNFMYQVDTLKDTLLELEEQLAESQRLYEEKSKELEREKHAHSVLQFQFAEVKEALRQREDMLEEIRQLQQKQASYIREISDLQETIEWKDKKIGALERQKEFFDSIRSERDDLREEVVQLKEELKKHGIILNSETATNGETSDTLNNVGYQGPTKMTKEELNALQSAGDGTLGRANGVEVKKEIVETVGKRETLQNAEQEQRKEHTGKECADVEGLRPGESAEHNASSPGPLASAGREGQVRGQSLGNASVLESPEQVGADKAAHTADGRTRASPERAGCLRELDGEPPGPEPVQDGGNASDTQNHRENSVVRQDRGKREDLKTDGEKSCRESMPEKMPDAEKISRATPGGPGGNHVENEVVAKEQVDTAASNPPAHSRATVNPDGKCTAAKLDPGTGRSVERELPAQEGGRLEEPPAQSSPRRADADSEADADKTPPPAEALDSSQKKAKNKKKKNKKKRTPAPVESPLDVKSAWACRGAEAGGAGEGGQVQLADNSQVTPALRETTENPEIAPGGPASPEDDEVSGKEGEVTAGGDTVTLEDGPVQSAGPGASSQLDEQTTEDQSSRAEPENEIGNGSSLPEKKGPAQGGHGAEHSGQTAAKALDGISLDSDDLSASAGEPRDLDSEGRGCPRTGSEKGKSKEDCTMS
ncbi:leucine-rich repeat flightless-interacting protein 1 isoform X4 [Perognathus longimembris pacificus]|uniref:leucine-rich repeat flightless-interacting protein 1 isoform X4 n=1 Tax=Perognathus longimembris pacificus TaxID=214514 RepID=UPI00201873DB|nr:leucine-rich repeat flightless-interacting protein 1 isoform X4 [Perognathus longimembris pacificus]